MRTYAFSNRKGGVGKTTLSTHFAHAAAMSGLKVILIDCDPQGNASKALTDETPAHQLADVLTGKVGPKEAAMSVRENLDVLATDGKSVALRDYSIGTAQTKPMLIKQLMRILSKVYDVAVLDLSPGMGSLEMSALAAADDAIVPVIPEPFSADGLTSFRDALRTIKADYDSDVRLRHVVINNVNRTMKVHRGYVEALTGIDGFTFHQIPQWAGFKAAQESYRSVFEGDTIDQKHDDVKTALNELTEALI